ncbi:other/FunK1 protein kinase [Coprinopsis cinerea okayama7|uniref:Other/FunK1 protein kinase n=1 Tax=Coprinopsis cinerea (strain Okayama-7 / 130 / ATCC MYA-4618 / FGSC 9003) TaxID=240176 RepID=A8NB29_COPC7|nr:other/FunK1 protein kinase [Coprinopsis cinerea okayama7\|eukprot:XP_001832031.2 other/FunK1 protein kinase [Coprinopsis cinerea okayama7\
MDSEIHTYHVGELLDCYLPNDHTDTVDTVLDELKKQRILVSRGRSVAQRASWSTRKPPYTHVFKGFKTLFRSSSAKPERILKSFQTIGNAVRKALGRIKGISVNEFEVRAMDSTGDACITPNRDGGISPPDVVVPVRVTGRRTDQSEDEDKDQRYVSHVNRIMNEDARRKFAYGMTFEHDSLSIWFMHRSRVAKSLPLKINQHPDTLVRLLGALFFAKEEQLGYDPLVTRLPDGSYVYELPPDGERPSSLYYRTVPLLSEYRSPELTGRRARVWRVKQVVSPTDPRRVPGTSDRVLKDVSVHEETMTEVEIQRQLFRDIRALSQDPNWRNRDILNAFDPATIESIAEALQNDRFIEYFSCIVAYYVESLPHAPPSSPPRKRRCFFVYEHVCATLYDIPTLGEATDIIRQSLTALRLMFCAGWVHRDVSPGNILTVRSTPESPWQVKMTDFEFATKFTHSGKVSASQVTGTPPFMACEIRTSTYILPPPCYDRVDMDGELPVQPQGPVVYNYQHDLESLWWILLWLTTARLKQSRSQEFGRELFTSDVGMSTSLLRANLFTKCIVDDRLLRKAIPSAVEPFIVAIENLRRDLYKVCTARNHDDKVDDIRTYSFITGPAFEGFFDDANRFRARWESLELMVETLPQPPYLSDESSAPAQLRLQPTPPEDTSGKKRKLGDVSEEGFEPKRRTRPGRDPVTHRPITRSMTRRLGRKE